MSGFVLFRVIEGETYRDWAVRSENVAAIFENDQGVYVKTVGDAPMRVEGVVSELAARVVTCEDLAPPERIPDADESLAQERLDFLIVRILSMRAYRAGGGVYEPLERLKAEVREWIPEAQR